MVTLMTLPWHDALKIATVATVRMRIDVIAWHGYTRCTIRNRCWFRQRPRVAYRLASPPSRLPARNTLLAAFIEGCARAPRGSRASRPSCSRCSGRFGSSSRPGRRCTWSSRRWVVGSRWPIASAVHAFDWRLQKRTLWAWLRTWREWRSALHIVQPDTVVGCHGRAFRYRCLPDRPESDCHP
jgi:hypothetical protein